MQQSESDGLEALETLLDPADDAVTTLANAAAFLYAVLNDVNWAGFYLLRENVLHLGPFQGKPACTLIEVGRGVCGAAIQQNGTLRVDDVHAFPGHIACDCASNSELVVVLRRKNGEPFGVLDLDSPAYARFTEADEAEMERAAERIARAAEENLWF